MSQLYSNAFAVALFGAAFPLCAAAQLPPPPPPLPPAPVVEIRPTVVEVAPPPLRVERRIASPGAGYVWARGYWDWAGSSWVWIHGRWVTVPVARATWVPAQYTRVTTGWRYVPAHWSSQRVVTVETVSKPGRSRAVGHAKAKGKGHWKGKGKGHAKHH